MAERPPQVEALWKQTTDWSGDIAKPRNLVDCITELLNGEEDVDTLKHANAPEFSSVKPVEPAAQISNPKGVHLNSDKPVVSDSAQSSKSGIINSQKP
ncbi:hypothetical protein AC579_2020 [Pseudocercospora musae]|uniref:Uncharacterized protein n=1 Tax=Pseudocercospora musae TaxID=113226 RepID=A0A139IRG7_9PEZI|nr:hypothetical protein AC579_2020 [Pseudocercospora musae]